MALGAVPLCLTGALVVPLLAQRPGQPPRDRVPDSAQPGGISGRVTTGSPPAPLVGSTVTARSGGGRTTESAVTDADGHYTLTGLTPGRYTVEARKGGHLTIQYGQTRSFDSGTPIQLAPAQRLNRVDLHLPRGGVFSGTVYDQHGAPAVGSRVQALRYQFNGGRWNMANVGRQDYTDDRGAYRLYGLPPGDYYLEASEPATYGRRSSPTYYPGTGDLGSARPIAVGIGEERLALDMTLTESVTVQVAGRVVGGGLPPSVSLVGRTPGVRVLSGRVQQDGSFTVEAVPPGDYILYTSTPSTDGPIEFARTDLTIDNVDIEGLLVRTTTGATAVGTIAVNGGVEVGFRPEDLQLFTMPQGYVDVPVGRGTGQVANDWSFEIQGIGDAQLVRLIGLPEDWELDAVLLNGQDITDQPVHLPAGRATQGFRVVVTDRTTRLLATVVDDDGRTVPGGQVVIFPTDDTRWTYPSRFVRTARPDQRGAIDVRGLPSERYLAFAAESIPRGAETDPDFLEQLRPLATSFTLGAGETRNLSIPLRDLP